MSSQLLATDNTSLKKKKARRSKGGASSQRAFIAKIAKRHLGQDKKGEGGRVVEKNPNKLTCAKEFLTELELLVNYGIGVIVNNADQVLDYSGQRTMGKSHVEIATTLALEGLLRKRALKAGSRAVANYNDYTVDAPNENAAVASVQGEGQ